MSDPDQTVAEPDVLTLDDTRSTTWLKLKKYMEAERDRLRARNDSDLPPLETQTVRGRILQLKNLLDLAHKPAPAESDEAE